MYGVKHVHRKIHTGIIIGLQKRIKGDIKSWAAVYLVSRVERCYSMS